MLRNLEKQNGKVEFSSIGCMAPTYNIIDELKAEGDWELLEKYSGFEFNDNAPKGEARTEYENVMYLERPDVTFVWVTRKKQQKEILF
jgi:aconitate hydratase 2/2-methylisocitrate dehydratase